MLLDEPLVNLDYKLREAARGAEPALFAAGDSTVVYATTEPGEALLLGGWTAVMDASELLQYGPTAEVYPQPAEVDPRRRAFSDPPMNLLAADAASNGGALAAGGHGPLGAAAASATSADASACAPARCAPPAPGDVSLPGTVELAEISGSDTFVHVHTTAVGEVVAQLTGVHQFELGAKVTLFLNPAQVYVFDANGDLLVAAPGK